ncbi:MAG: ATP-binding protein [Synechococcales bacterium]|nr:ATP-binding protein [Synechococcales bacterium]
MPPSTETDPPAYPLQRFLGEARTRVLLLYILVMLGVTAIAIPLFYKLLFIQISARVQEDLAEEVTEFQEEYAAWAATNPPKADLKGFINGFIEEGIPEDDNFHIFLVGDTFYRANPSIVPRAVRPNPDLMAYWLDLSDAAAAKPTHRLPLLREQPSDDSKVGSILYAVIPLVLDNEVQGTFVATHLTAGERQEALVGVYLFAQIALGVVLISFVLAWMGSRQLFAPVRSLATTARAISESNLSARLPSHGSGELAELTATFNAMMNRLQGAFESQRSFINDASHELRTPITIIQGHLELMGDDPAEQQETLELVMDELDRMARFVNDLILLAKAERPDFLRPETVDIATFTAEIHQKAIALARRQWLLQNQGRGKLVGDRQRLAGAWINLINNAVQHTQAGDTIEIGSAMDGRHVKFWVRDTGEGIAPHDQVRIFERFARAANSYRRSEGAGLGLAIVKAVVEAHGGHVELVSQPGAGSTFTLILPLELPQESHAA